MNVMSHYSILSREAMCHARALIKISCIVFTQLKNYTYKTKRAIA
jgi:hypothetical protein